MAAGTSARTIHKGPVASKTKETDGELFISAFSFMFDVGTWTATRNAAGNYSMVHTAAANSPNPGVNLTEAFGLKKIGADPNWDVYVGSAPTTIPADLTHDIRGFQITAIDVVYSIATIALTSHSAQLNRATYANNSAVVVAAVGGSLAGTLATATQAQPYLTTLTPATPFIVGNNLTDVTEWFEINAVCQATTAYALYGIFVRYNYNLL